MAVAIVLLTASWGSAGNFEVLADAGLVRAPTPLHIRPGTLVKAEFKSNMKTTSDLDFEADSLFPEKVAAQNAPKVRPRPAVAFRERAKATMAPPPRTNPDTAPGVGPLAESLEQATDMEEDLAQDLAKDLVVPPPPAKVEDTGPQFKKPSGSAEGGDQGIFSYRAGGKAEDQNLSDSEEEVSVRVPVETREPQAHTEGQAFDSKQSVGIPRGQPWSS